MGAYFIGRARVLAGRIVSPVDEALIPPGMVRPAGSRALPLNDTARGRARVLAGRIVSPVDEALIPPGIVRPARSRALPNVRLASPTHPNPSASLAIGW